MGDIPPHSAAQPLDSAPARLTYDQHLGNPDPSTSSLKSPTSNTPFYSQHGSIPQAQARLDPRSHAHAAGPSLAPPDHGSTSLNMGAMTGALPEYASVDAVQANLAHPQHSQHGAPTSAVVYPLQKNVQVAAPPAGSLLTHSPFTPGFGTGQYPPPNFAPPHASQHPNYGVFPPNTQRIAIPGPIRPPYQGFAQPSQYLYYPVPFGNQPPYPPAFPGQNPQGQAMYGRRPSLNDPRVSMAGQTMDLPQQDGGFQGHHMMHGAAHGVGPVGSTFVGQPMQSQGYQHIGPVHSIPRGPPRKPKQSGHALWVGNLPPGTTVVALKDHFSRDATKDIESLFLISKSNCAFVNYRTEASCAAAMHRFHDSRFNGVRLVCRLRRTSAPASGTPTGPSAMVGSQAGASPTRPSQEVDGEALQADFEEPRVDGDAPQMDDEITAPKKSDAAKDESPCSAKYFIVKSLTLQDLELSLRNGIWATQSHNEDTLNRAFETADNVYLIFSANKSGEYFGYARMASQIPEDGAHSMNLAPKLDEANILKSADVPKSIPTPATEFAPKGRIIDDSARGTIFWEAELSESEGEDETGEREDTQAFGDIPTVAQSWGKPFRIEWISTNRLPFYRTRGLRNPWNANREVKIARDGTELEPSVGERLVQMFHRLGPSAPLMPPPQIGAPQIRLFQGSPG